MFATTLGFSQITKVNLADYKAYKITVTDILDQLHAENIAKSLEKSNLATLVWIDYVKGEGYCILKSDKLIAKVETEINNQKATWINTQEINLDDNKFFGIYSQKGGTATNGLSESQPNYVKLINESESAMFYHNAKQIWMNKYPEIYKSEYGVKSVVGGEKRNIQDMPEHCPKFINTGNPDYDNSVYEQAKREWIKNYPEEYNKMFGVTTK
jgi:hypothetical protein